MLARLLSSPCIREEDFEEVEEVIEAMTRLGRKARARELAASAERVLDQRFLRGLVAFLGRLDFSLRGQGGGVGGAKGGAVRGSEGLSGLHFYFSPVWSSRPVAHIRLKGCEKGWTL